MLSFQASMSTSELHAMYLFSQIISFIRN